MRTLLLAVAALLLSNPAASQKQPRKPPEVEVLETKARRVDGQIQVDVRVRTGAEKPLRGLVLYFDLLSAENGVVSSQKAVLDPNPVEPGQERSYQAVTSDPVRAVKYKIRAFDAGERELRIANSGPFVIE